MTPSQTARRTTPQRDLVRTGLAETSGFVSAQDLHARLLAAGHRIGLATVYRALAWLAGRGEADTVRTSDGETAYRHCSPTHHHHLICRACGRTVEIAEDPIEAWAADVAARHGFRDIAHVIEIDGLCPDC
ncbi:MAG: transcriptional repressor [Actinomycetia bacterium]|nr:transcriptional repressor [Actinomycetes bacterium]